MSSWPSTFTCRGKWASSSSRLTFPVSWQSFWLKSPSGLTKNLFQLGPSLVRFPSFHYFVSSLVLDHLLLTYDLQTTTTVSHERASQQPRGTSFWHLQCFCFFSAFHADPWVRIGSRARKSTPPPKKTAKKVVLVQHSSKHELPKEKQDRSSHHTC